jgi:uncharacterized protein YecT (DUF1311 family)
MAPMRHLICFIFASLSASSFALNCELAKTTVELDICSNHSLKAKDDELNKKYKYILGISENKDQVKLSQREWLAQRDASCGSDELGSTRVSCLDEIIDERLHYFSPKVIRSNEGFLELVPYIGFQKANEDGRTNVDIKLIKFNKPNTKGQKIFNESMYKIISKATWFADPTEESDMYFISIQSQLNYVSPRFISVTINDGSGYPNTAGAQGSIHTVNINIKDGRLAEFRDIFKNGSLDLIKSSCDKQIRNNKLEMGIEPDRESYLPAIENKAQDMDAWLLTDTRATLMFGAYEVGAGVEGFHECDFTGDTYKQIVIDDLFK